MTKEKKMSVKTYPVKHRFYGALVVCLLLLIVCGAISIPFVYQSQTIWYKVGIDKIMLYGGQIAGLLAAVLLFVQILLAVRGAVLEEVFGAAALMRWHRVNGLLICLFMIFHIALVLLPEGFSNLPIGKKHWPEMLGGGLFLIILSMVISSLFRQTWGLVYRRWRVVHKPLGYLSLLLVTVHVLFVSESFQNGVPKVAFICLLVGTIIFVLLAKKKIWPGQRQQRR